MTIPDPFSSAARDIVPACGIGTYALYGVPESSLAAFRQAGCPSVPYDGDTPCDWLVCAGQLPCAPGSERDFLASLPETSARSGIVIRSLSFSQRDAFEQAAIDAGWRKHPVYHALAEYGEADLRKSHYDSAFERVPAAAERRWPLAKLLDERALHMDMSRVTGRRADAHTVRYRVAASFVRPGDIVVDCACGYGYGTHILAKTTQAERVIGIDLSEQSIAYAQAHYSGSRASFATGDATDLSRFADGSVDLFVSFETLEHLPDPELLLKEVARVLRPGGRLVASVPNLWIDETGKDPNPYHFQVYDRARAEADVGRHLLIDTVIGQIAGGNELKFTDHPRSLGPLKAGQDTEWILIVAMKDPVAAAPSDYHERILPYIDLPLDWTRLYDNPFLGHFLVSPAWRMHGQASLEAMAQRVIETSRDGSPDVTAALCVLGYRLLETGEASGHEAWRRRTDAALHALDPAHPAALRWQVSLLYLDGCLLERTGQSPAALARYRQAAALPASDFHPSLLTKRASAAWRAARLAAAHGDPEGAVADLENATAAAFDFVASPGFESFGRLERPHPFYLEEGAAVMKIAGMAARAVEAFRRSDSLGFTRALAAEVDLKPRPTAILPDPPMVVMEDRLPDAVVRAARPVVCLLRPAVRLARRLVGRPKESTL